MDLKTPLKIPVLYNNPDNEQLVKLGIDIEDGGIEIPMIFYTVDNISIEGVNSSNTIITSGGYRYVTSLKLDYLAQVIYQVQNPELFNDNGFMTKVS